MVREGDESDLNVTAIRCYLSHLGWKQGVVDSQGYLMLDRALPNMYRMSLSMYHSLTNPSNPPISPPSPPSGTAPPAPPSPPHPAY